MHRSADSDECGAPRHHRHACHLLGRLPDQLEQGWGQVQVGWLPATLQQVQMLWCGSASRQGPCMAALKALLLRHQVVQVLA